MLPSFNYWGNLSRRFSGSGADLSKGLQQALERLESVAARKESEIIAWKSAIQNYLAFVLSGEYALERPRVMLGLNGRYMRALLRATVQCRCFADQIWIGIGAEGTGLGPDDSRFPESSIPQRVASAHHLGIDFQDFFDSKIAHGLSA